MWNRLKSVQCSDLQWQHGCSASRRGKEALGWVRLGRWSLVSGSWEEEKEEGRWFVRGDGGAGFDIKKTC